MPRPLKASGDLRRRFDLYLDEAEIESIRTRATSVRLPMSTYVRKAALDLRIDTPPPAINVARWSELARLAGNLNQIARACNSGLVPQDVRPTLRALADQVRELRQELLGVRT
jgi:hypothetical protein